MLRRFIPDIDTSNEPSRGMLAGYSLSIISNSKKNNEEIQEILITNGKDMPKGRNILLKHYKGKK
jgi:hypothetical protein